MLEASTSGHGPLKHKTINAEVNLLSEWLRKRDSLNEQITRAAIVLGVVARVTFGSAPFLLRAFFDASSRLHSAEVLSETQSINLTRAEQDKKVAAPKLDQGAMHDTVVREAQQFIGHTMEVMNSAKAGMAFQSVSANVISGDLTITCKADAESNAVVQSFIEDAGKGDNVKSTLLRTAEKDTKLSAQGVSFEYVKGVAVSQ